MTPSGDFIRLRYEKSLQALHNVPQIPSEDITEFSKFSQGVFGEVYRGAYAQSNGPPVEVAIKKMRRPLYMSKSRNDNFMETFEREALALWDCRHKHILRLYGFVNDSEDCRLHLVTEFAVFGEMGDLLFKQERALAYSKAIGVRWCIGIADALAFLHQKQMVHRDLKPANILMFDDYQTPKLCDFGFTRKVDVSMSGHRGSRLWMAPEMFTPAFYDHRREHFRNDCSVDIYSFGIIMWQIFARKLRFVPDSMGVGEFEQQVTLGLRPDRLLVEVPDVIDDVMTRAWQHEPSDRPDAQEIKTIFQSFHDSMLRRGAVDMVCDANDSTLVDHPSMGWGSEDRQDKGSCVSITDAVSALRLPVEQFAQFTIVLDEEEEEVDYADGEDESSDENHQTVLKRGMSRVSGKVTQV